MKRIIITLTISALAVFALGCSSFSSKNSEETASTPKPVQDIVEEEVVYASSTNPVSLFYSDYYNAVGYIQQLFESRLEENPSKEASQTLLCLAAHDSLLSEGRSTFGLLLSTDSANTFSSSLIGVSDGTGSITPVSGENFYIPTIATETEENEETEDTEIQQEAESTPAPTPVPTPEPTPSPIPEAETDADQEQANGQNYSLYFAYSNSRVIYGSLTPTKLAFTALGEEGGAELRCEDAAWHSMTSCDGVVCNLSFDGTELRFVVKANGEEKYSWVCNLDTAYLNNEMPEVAIQ